MTDKTKLTRWQIAEMVAIEKINNEIAILQAKRRISTANLLTNMDITYRDFEIVWYEWKQSKGLN